PLSRVAVTAASTSAVMCMTPTKHWERRRLSSGESVTNGPLPCAVNHNARPATTRLATVAPGWRKRTAAHISAGKTTKIRPADENANTLAHTRTTTRHTAFENATW